MLVGAAIMGVTLFGTAEVQNLWQWVLLRGLAFMLGAALVGNLIVNVTLSKWWVRRRGTMIGFAAMGVSAAGVLFPFLATTLIEEFGWRTAWRILAVVSVVVLYPCALAMRRQPEDYGLHPDGLSDAQAAGAAGQQAASDYANSFTRAEALRTPALYLIVLAFAISSVGLSNMLLQTIPFLTDAGYTGSQAALYSGLMSFASLVSKPVWGWTTTRWEPKYAAAVGFVLAGAALMSVIHTAGMQASVPLAAGFAVIGLGFGSQIPLAETIWAAYFGRRYLGSVRGVALPLSFGLAAGSPLVVSWYFDRVGNYDGVFAFIAALWGVAAVVILFAKRPVKRTPAPEAAPAA
jgi:MFS family permease